MNKQLICKYCGDPIYDFQQKTMRDGMHEGCADLKDAEMKPRPSAGNTGLHKGEPAF